MTPAKLDYSTFSLLVKEPGVAVGPLLKRIKSANTFTNGVAILDENGTLLYSKISGNTADVIVFIEENIRSRDGFECFIVVSCEPYDLTGISSQPLTVIENAKFSINSIFCLFFVAGIGICKLKDSHNNNSDIKSSSVTSNVRDNMFRRVFEQLNLSQTKVAEHYRSNPSSVGLLQKSIMEGSYNGMHIDSSELTIVGIIPGDKEAKTKGAYFIHNRDFFNTNPLYPGILETGLNIKQFSSDEKVPKHVASYKGVDAVQVELFNHDTSMSLDDKAETEIFNEDDDLDYPCPIVEESSEQALPETLADMYEKEDFIQEFIELPSGKMCSEIREVTGVFDNYLYYKPAISTNGTPDHVTWKTLWSKTHEVFRMKRHT